LLMCHVKSTTDGWSAICRLGMAFMFIHGNNFPKVKKPSWEAGSLQAAKAHFRE
jgi:hypothetical protein